MRKIRVFIADDHALLRVGLLSMLKLEPDMEVVGEASNGYDAIQAVLDLRPDVVIMDLQMPRMNGAAATRQIMRALPQTRVIILTSFATSDEMQQAVSYGAVGLQPKEDPIENLIHAIRSVYNGETAFPADFTPRTVSDASPSPLTEKQMVILKMLAEGLIGKQVATRLNISEQGVKKHVRLILTKLGAANRTEAISLAIKKHLLRD